jgi:DNA polymerase-1
VVAAADGIKGVAGENLRKALDWLPTGRKLITVVTDCDLAGHVPGWPALEALALRRWMPEGLLDFYQRYGFKTWRGLEGSGARGAAKPRRPAAAAMATTGAAPATDAGRATTRPSPPGSASTPGCSDAGRRAGGAGHRDRFAGRHAARIVGISFATEPGRAAYVPLAHDYPGAPEQLPLQARCWTGCGPGWKTRPAKVGQNIKYDLHVLANAGITVRGYATTPCCRATCWKRTSRTAWKRWPSATWAARA